MNMTYKFTALNSLVAFALLAVSVSNVNAQAAPAASAMLAEMTQAEVRKIEAESRKITLKHGEIKSLDMPPMTMVFGVKEASLLEALKVGDKIQFLAEKINGQYVVTKITK
jgi:Cu(I)/Ag(I) efflux system periplasmic protein CusF